MDVAVIAARVVQFAAAAVLFGAPLFLLYGLQGPDRAAQAWPRPALTAASLALVVGALAGLSAQTAAMAGDPAAAFDRATLADVATTPFGVAMLARWTAAAAALALCLSARPGGSLWLGLSGLGAVALATFPWTGHGAATEGAGALSHLVADILHLLAAGVWLGALAALALMLRAARGAPDLAAGRALHGALAGFSGVGSAVVATLLLSGLVNSWFLVGPQGVWRLTASPYGLFLLAKLALFAIMLGLATVNRFALTPRLAAGLAGNHPAAALDALRRSLILETGAAGVILVLVAILGGLAPPAAQ